MAKASDKLNAYQSQILGYILHAAETQKGVSVQLSTKQDVVRFRNNFNNLKIKLQAFGSDLLEIVGPIGCFIDRTDNGWEVRLMTAREAMGNPRVTDIATGEEIFINR